MKARVKWVDGAMMIGESGSGHAIVMDGAPEYGGRDMGVRPMEMLLLGLGGCTEFDVIHILNRGRHQVDSCAVDITAERAEKDPKIFTKIHVQFTVAGPGLNDKIVSRAVSLSAEKFCSASIMLGRVAQITHDHTVIDTADNAEVTK